MKKLICVLLALMLLLAFAACDAKTEPAKKDTKTTQGTETENTIITVTVLHGDGEESSSRMTTTCDNLADALIERNFMTEDMLTVGGEKADPAQGAYWTLYIDGVYATESWDQISVESGVEYMFEYTIEEIFEEPIDEELEGPGEGEIGESVDEPIDEPIDEPVVE